MTPRSLFQEQITLIKGIGPSVYLKFSRKGIETVGDLLCQFPTRYEDLSTFGMVASLLPGETVTLLASVKNLKHQVTRKRGFTIQTAVIEDNSGEIEVNWFNQPYILKGFKTGEKYYFAGRVVEFNHKLTLQPLEWEDEGTLPLHTRRIVPYYSDTLGQSSRFVRQKLNLTLELIKNENLLDILGQYTKHELLPLRETLNEIHFPSSMSKLDEAQKRIRYEQLTQVRLIHEKEMQQKTLLPFKTLTIVPNPKNAVFVKKLPFTLTSSQQKTIEKLSTLFKEHKHCERLLMGDVGSGKTVVMSYLAWLMFLNKQKTVILVPTEILGEQHAQSFASHLAFASPKIALVSGKCKTENLGDADIIIGTHKLLFQKKLPEFSLLIIDEQHKFGVKQRDQLLKEMPHRPHLLTVSATPIPRSLALSMYGNVEIDYLSEKPHSARVKTFLVPEEKRTKAYEWIRGQVLQKRVQVYVVCPAIERKETTSKIELKTVNDEYAKLTKLLPDIKIAAIHSQHPEKNQIITDFKKGNYDVLISTSLIEVGLDIGRANIMLIENAERFGLSQLHQFRGRIGRRNEEAYCFLFTESNSPESLTRLNVLTKTTDALKISTQDLELRGPGNILGIQQHGFLYLDFETLMDEELMQSVAITAKHILDNCPKIDYTSILVRNIILN